MFTKMSANIMQGVLCTLQIEDFMQGNQTCGPRVHSGLLHMTNVKTVSKSLIIQLFLFNKPKCRSRHLSKVKCISASQQVV